MNNLEVETEGVKFRKPLSAYVHAEVTASDNALYVTGDPRAVLQVAERLINEVSKKSETDFYDVMKIVSELHDLILEMEA